MACAVTQMNSVVSLEPPTWLVRESSLKLPASEIRTPIWLSKTESCVESRALMALARALRSTLLPPWNESERTPLMIWMSVGVVVVVSVVVEMHRSSRSTVGPMGTTEPSFCTGTTMSFQPPVCSCVFCGSEMVRSASYCSFRLHAHCSAVPLLDPDFGTNASRFAVSRLSKRDCWHDSTAYTAYPVIMDSSTLPLNTFGPQVNFVVISPHKMLVSLVVQ